MEVIVMQSNLYVHIKYEYVEEIYLYPIWGVLKIFFSKFLFPFLS